MGSKLECGSSRRLQHSIDNPEDDKHRQAPRQFGSDIANGWTGISSTLAPTDNCRSAACTGIRTCIHNRATFVTEHRHLACGVSTRSYESGAEQFPYFSPRLRESLRNHSGGGKDREQILR